MTVTILVPVYGVEKYIEECACSLFEQTYNDLEYVFVDDCTPDNSIAILKNVIDRYPDRKDHVRIIRQEKNTGIGGTRARLVEEIKTDFFCFVDSDDMLPVNAIEVLARKMKETDADIVEGAYQNYNNGKKETIVLPFHGSQKRYQQKLHCQNILKNNLWARLIKSSAIAKVRNLFENGIDYSEDYSAIARLSLVTRRAWTDEVVYYYRTDNINSYTKQVSAKNVYSVLKSCSSLLKFCLMRGHLPLSTEMGVLNTYRFCNDNGVKVSEVDDVLHYVPEHITAMLLYRMLRSEGAIYWLGDKLYRVLRLIMYK